ncbi:MAG: EF-hand domain-containing protein [Devosia sp.]
MSISSLSGAIAGAGSRRAFQPPSFESLDTNQDNSITLEELKAGTPGGASATSDKRAEALFKAIDTDGSGGISADEKSAFDDKVKARHTDHHAGLAFLAQQLSGPSNDDVFAASDTKGDGSVSLDELSNDDAAKGVSPDSLKKLFSLIDSNGDGSISSAESSSFLDAVKTAVAANGPHAPPPGGGEGGGPPPPPPAGSGSNGSADLLSRAQSAYTSTTKSTDLVSILQSLLQTAA